MPVTQRKRSYQLFQKLKFNVWNGFSAPTAVDECQLDIDKMILHVLDCLGGLQCVMGEYDMVRAKVFWGAVATIAEIGIDQTTGHVDRRHPGATHLLRAFPNEQKASERKCWLPLHWAAVTDNVDVEDIRKIARADPLATMKGFQQPLSANPGHLIAAVRCPKMDVVRCLYNFYPRMASTRDSEGELPLHYAARYSESVEMIQFLLQAYPAATKMKGEGNLVPLHNALYNQSAARFAIAKCLLDADPSAARLLGSDGDTCFHIAIDQECDQALLRDLIYAFPEGLLTPNDIGYLPLHVACLARDSPRNKEVVELLLRAQRSAASVACTAGLLPVHIAAEHATADVLQSIVGAFPAGLNQVCSAEDFHCTPLMKAIASGNESCVRFFCENFPATTQTINSAGSNVLHLAAEGDSVEVMRCVYKTFPESIRIMDRYGRLPLHAYMVVHQDLVSERSSEADCLRFLLKHCPEAVGAEDAAGDTPFVMCPLYNRFLRRLMLREQPGFGLEEFHALNYENRRLAMFLAFDAINADGIPNVFFRLRAKNLHLLQYVVSFL